MSDEPTDDANKPEQPRTLLQRIAAVMSEVSYVRKTKKGKGMMYNFVSHDSVIAALRPHLVTYGIVVIPTLKSTTQNGNRTESVYIVRFVNVDNGDDFIEIQTFGFGIDSQDKGPGKACSYAYKYALLKTFCLETGDDPESSHIDHNPMPANPQTGWTSTPAGGGGAAQVVAPEFRYNISDMPENNLEVVIKLLDESGAVYLANSNGCYKSPVEIKRLVNYRI